MKKYVRYILLLLILLVSFIFKVKKYSLSFSHAKSNKNRKCLIRNILCVFLPEARPPGAKVQVFHLNGESRILSYLSDSLAVYISQFRFGGEYSLLILTINWVSTVKSIHFIMFDDFRYISYWFFFLMSAERLQCMIFVQSLKHFRVQRY